MKDHFKKLAGFIAAALAVALLAGPTAQAQNPMGANKTAAIGNTDEVLESGLDTVILEEQLRVSSPADFILNVSAECAIITQLVTGDGPASDTDEANASGQVQLWLTIDGKRVPVAGDPNGDNGDDGTVVFCNHSRGRQVIDAEDDDGQDRIGDYLSARQANAFQWLATNVGFAYDDRDSNGQNIIDVELHARFTDSETADCNTLAGAEPTTTYAETCSKAYVGKRTLIVEHTKATVIENTASSSGGS